MRGTNAPAGGNFRRRGDGRFFPFAPCREHYHCRRRGGAPTGRAPRLGFDGGRNMATLANAPLSPAAGDERFFLRAAIVMTLTIVAGFSLQLAMGRSTFNSPPLVHAHAIIFMGWVTIYLLQNILVATGRINLHRRLGWVAAGWMLPMIVLGFGVTLSMVRRGQVPFFFQPLHFLVFDPLSLLTFAALTGSAILLRARTEWHRRLHLCGMAMLMGPGFGRLLPMPLLQPWAWEASFAAGLIFPIVGIMADLRRSGHVHPAWRWGLTGMIGGFV